MEEEFLKIVNHYGISNQLKYIHSEYFELDEAILDYESDDYYDIEHETDLKQHIAEEIADVMVMLNDEPLEINRVFGLSCISTPALSDLEFEVR